MRISRDCFANFVADFRTTFSVRVSHECRENFHVSRTSRELVAKFLNMFKNFMRIFSTKYFARLSRECSATIARRSCECRKPVSAKCGEFTMRNFCDTRTNVMRVSHGGRATASRLSGEKIKLNDIRTNVVRHSYECRSTLVRMSRDCRTN